MDQKRSEKLIYGCILVLAICIYMAKPWDSTLQAMDSAIHAKLALEVTRGGHLLPQLPMPLLSSESGAGYFNDHPFLAFYGVGHFMRAFGVNAWGARFLPALFGVLNIALVLALARRIAGYSASLWAGIFLLAAPLATQFTARFQLDPFMIFFILASFWFSLQKCWWGAGIASGLAVCFKSPAGWLILPTLLVVDRISLNWLKVLLPAILLPLSLWLYANFQSGQPLLQDYWSRQVFGTAVGGRDLSARIDWWMGLQVFKNNLLLGWIFFFAAVGMSYFKKTSGGFAEKIKKRELKLVFIGTFILVLVISAVRFKFTHYFLPAIYLGAISLAAFVPAFFETRVSILEKTLMVLAPVLTLSLLILPIQTAPEAFPALRRFAPFIQSEGNEGDRVLFIDHAQPYGSFGDYYVETVFYTGRKFLSSSCAQASEKIAQYNPEWVVTSGKTSDECFGGKHRTSYPSVWKFGNQFLLSRYPQKKNEMDLTIDLTPLIRELKVPLDGNPAPLPVDIFYRFE